MKRATLIDFQEFFNHKAVSGRLDGKPGGLSPKTLHNMKVMMRGALNYAVYPLKLIPNNPMLAIQSWGKRNRKGWKKRALPTQTQMRDLLS